VVGDTTCKEGGQKHVPALKVPRQCPLVLLVEVRLKGEALGGEKGEIHLNSIYKL
jgi:hypothetical protein